MPTHSWMTHRKIEYMILRYFYKKLARARASKGTAADRHLCAASGPAARWRSRLPSERTSPLEAHAQWLLDLVAREPDLTLEEIQRRL
jgi:hypothetical protein